MTKKWMERPLEECINICFDVFAAGPQSHNVYDYFISEIVEIVTLHNTKFSYPYLINWALTSNCNLRCKHCVHLKSGFFDQKEELTTEQIFKVIDEIHKTSAFYLVLTGGELFTRKDIFDILKYIKKRNIGVFLFSNGINIDEEAVSKLKNILNPNIDLIRISLDGTKEVHEEIRGKGTYDKAINAIKNLISEGFKIDVSFTVLSKNVEVLPDVFKLCAEMGVYTFTFGSVMIYNNSQAYLLPDKELFFKAHAEIINLLKEYPDIVCPNGSIKSIEFYEFVDYIKYLTPENKEAIDDFIKENNHKKTVCCHLGGRAYINPSGLLFPCNDCEGIKDDFAMGDLKQESFQEIWDRRFDNPILQERNLDDIEGCNDCDYKNICNGNCPIITYSKQNSIYKPPAECKVWK